ncbi:MULTISPECIES: acyl-CoA dehydrogenase family protein [Streptomyces]|uniref:acyl-CoA dehydrogenase family protein n=1 Tax=Streptomyces TaxID=1883 RepID=UPI000880DAAF|nr:MULTISPECIES: acyl-CoA dehydrogenase family protein [Streptomyces]MDW4918673.1 acyl-CoA dehydrogenase family protein [Streptomyces californicus]MYW79227.1 acyl-CoA dehydrogenase [Streptomyces sp. SID8369]SDE37347.1 acyl-CoA dehydrogenase [Streptomyces sp. LaPpAH-199]
MKPLSPELTDRLATVVDAVARHADESDDKAAFPVEGLTSMRTSGLLGLLVPTRYGGLGATVADLLAASQQIARHDMSAAMILAMHGQQVAALAGHASPTLREQVLPRVAAGELYLGSVTTEAGTGGHLLSSQADTRKDGDLIQLDRMAPIVTGGAYADAYLITVKAPEATTDGQVSLVYAERDQLDIQILGGWDPMGMRGTHSVPMRFTGAVPHQQVVGAHGEFRRVTIDVFAPLAHLGWSACWLGTAAGALSRTVQMLRSPQERRRRDLKSELLLTRLARTRQRIDTVQAMLSHATDVYSSLSESDRGGAPWQLLSNSLKVTASEQCLAAVEELIETVGLRHGYLRHQPLALERAQRDLRSASLNYANDRLLTANGSLSLLDQETVLV